MTTKSISIIGVILLVSTLNLGSSNKEHHSDYGGAQELIISLDSLSAELVKYNELTER